MDDFSRFIMSLSTHILLFTCCIDLTPLFLLLVHLLVLLSFLCGAVPLSLSHPQNYVSLQISLSSELQPSSIPADESSSDMLVIVDEPVSSAPQSRATNSPASIAGSVSDTMNGGYPRFVSYSIINRSHVCQSKPCHNAHTVFIKLYTILYILGSWETSGNPHWRLTVTSSKFKLLFRGQQGMDFWVPFHQDSVLFLQK